jgi:hypothetical protein
MASKAFIKSWASIERLIIGREGIGTNANRMVAAYPIEEKISASCNLALSVTNIALNHTVRELKRMLMTIGMMLMTENGISGIVTL